MPGPYYYERAVDIPLDFDFEGDHVVLNKGDRLSDLDACKLIRFINAASAQDGGGGVDDQTPEGLDAVQEECSAMGGGPGGLAPPPDLPPVDDPSATDSGDPQSHESEDADSLGAPKPEPKGEVN